MAEARACCPWGPGARGGRCPDAWRAFHRCRDARGRAPGRSGVSERHLEPSREELTRVAAWTIQLLPQSGKGRRRGSRGLEETSKTYQAERSAFGVRKFAAVEYFNRKPERRLHFLALTRRSPC